MEQERTASSVAVDAGLDEDALLLGRVARGEHSALAALYERWKRPLFAFLSTRVPDHQVAEEVLQDTLVAIWRGAGTFEGRSRASTWMFSIARRQAWNRMRGKRSRSPVKTDLTAIPETGAGPEEVIVARDDVATLAQAIRRLSPLHREVLILAFEGRLTQIEIADVLAIPVGTVKSRLSTARRQLMTELSEGDRYDD